MSESEYLLNDEDTLIRFENINQMLDEDPKYLKEFCEAGVKSFTRFKNEFEESMRKRNLKNLRKAGHRIKPVAQMIGVQQVNEIYKEAKDLVKNNEDDTAIEASVLEIQTICNRIAEEFELQIEKL